MIWPLFLHLVRHSWRGPVRIAAVLGLLAFELVRQAVEASTDLPPDQYLRFLTLALVSGTIGADLSSGRLALLLARPVERWRYAVTSWAASGTVAVVVLLSHLAASLVVAATFGVGDLPTPMDIAVEAGIHVGLGFGMAAVLAALGTVVGGHGGSGTWFVVTMLAKGVFEAGQSLHVAFLVELGRAMSATLIPRIDLLAAFTGSSIAWSEVLEIPATILGSLLVATLVLVRREPRSTVTAS